MLSLKLTKLWHIAGIVAEELRLIGAIASNPGTYSRVTEDQQRLISTLKRSARWSGFTSALMVGLLTFLTLMPIPYASILGDPEIILVLSITMFLGLALILIFVLNLQNTSAYFSANSIELLSTLPVSQNDFDTLCTLSFLRIFFAPVLAILTLFPIGILILFGPVIAGAALLSCIVAVLLSIGALVKASRWYHQKMISAPNSRWGSVIRVVSSLGLIVGMFAVIGLMNYLPALIQFLTQVSAGLDSFVFTILAWVFPVSFGLIFVTLVHGMILPILTILSALIAASVYCILAVYSFRWSGRSLRTTTAADVSKIEGIIDRMDFKPSRPLSGIIRKDLRLGSRSMSAIMIFALPLLMAIFTYPFFTMSATGVVRSTNALIGVGYAQVFTAFSIVGLLSIDTQGASIFAGLPLRSYMNLQAKALIFLVCEVLAMSIIALVLFFTPLIVPVLFLMPLFQIPCGYAYAMTVGSTIYLRKGGGSAVALNLASEQGLVILSMITGAIVGILPLIGYAFFLLSTGSHILSLGAQLSVAVLASMVLWIAAPRILK